MPGQSLSEVATEGTPGLRSTVTRHTLLPLIRAGHLWVAVPEVLRWHGKLPAAASFFLTPTVNRGPKPPKSGRATCGWPCQRYSVTRHTLLPLIRTQGFAASAVRTNIGEWHCS